MKRRIALLCVMAMLLLMCSCGTKPGEELVGKWRSPGGGANMSLYEDGTLRYENIGNSIQSGRWSVSGGELTIEIGGNKNVFGYQVQGNSLILERNGDTQTWSR